MELATSSVFSPGSQGEPVFLDQILLLPQLGLLAVADGVGEPADLRAGARIALDSLRTHVQRNEDIIRRFERNPVDELRQRLLTVMEEGFARAAQELFAFARRRVGIQVTMDAVLVVQNEAFVSHLGDGRVYLMRRGLVHQLTVDHERSQEALASFDVGTDDEVRYSRSLGPHPYVRAESMCMELAVGDRFVLATRHVHAALPDAVLQRHMIQQHLDGLGPALAQDAGPACLVAACAQLGGGEPFTADSAHARLALLAPMPLFAHCTERELRQVAQATRPHKYRRGQVIFDQGQPGTELYLVIQGAVSIEKNKQTIAMLGAGMNFGEMAMLDEPQRSATARAAEDCELMVIPRDAFFAMLKGNPMLAVKILWNMTLRLSANLRTTSARLAELERLID